LDGNASAGWFQRHVRKEAEKDVLALSERIGQIAGVVIGLLFAWYFLDLYDSGSDFFTSDFDDLDAVLFFGIAFLGVVPGLIKAIMGRKNSVRPLDVALSVGVLVVLAWFLYAFPFDFAYLSEGLPESIQFLLDWIGNEEAKAIMAIGLVVNLVLVPYTTALFFGVRRTLTGRTG